MDYPIKAALVNFDNRNTFGIDNMVHRYYVSCITSKVASFGLQTCIAAWNEHPSGTRGFIFMISDYHVRRMSESTIVINVLA